MNKGWLELESDPGIQWSWTTLLHSLRRYPGRRVGALCKFACGRVSRQGKKSQPLESIDVKCDGTVSCYLKCINCFLKIHRIYIALIN